jgi:hypothetical protein
VLSGITTFFHENSTENNTSVLKRFATLKSPADEISIDILSLIASVSLELSQSQCDETLMLCS